MKKKVQKNGNSMVEILESTEKKPLTLIGRMASVCKGNVPEDEETLRKIALSCIRQGHYRVLEYVDVYISMQNVSARFAREWYTHIGGSPTRLQESTRYVDSSSFMTVVPPSIMQNASAFDRFSSCMKRIRDTYRELNDLGIPREDSAMVLPLGMTTRLSLKHNARNLMDMSRQRLCGKAYWEFRDVFSLLVSCLEEYSPEWKTISNLIFKPKCEVSGKCLEDLPCGHFAELST